VTQTIAEFLAEASAILEDAGVADPRREAASLLTLALRQDKTFLFAHPEYHLTEGEIGHYREYVRRRSGREPFQYISGVQEFYDLDFEVTPDVLIPRPETEMLVERAIEILRDKDGSEFCEIGVGSGCISVSILANVKDATATALDISTKAIGVAMRNAEKHSVRDRITFIESDLFSGIEAQKFDLIASNPPYVPSADIDGLQAEVRNFEPLTALTDGGDGLSIVNRIVLESPNFMRSGGFLLMEIGIGQAEKVTQIFDHTIWKTIEIAADFQGIPRLVCARLK
jgi:release factor glutamine methyltransferase